MMNDGEFVDEEDDVIMTGGEKFPQGKHSPKSTYPTNRPLKGWGDDHSLKSCDCLDLVFRFGQKVTFFSHMQFNTCTQYSKNL